jgi:CheY-like chemotaxis protein
VALLDIGLPDMDGYELAECIRERLGEESPVFAALTGYGQEGNRDRSRAASFRHHFVKPIDIDALNAFLETLPRGRPDAT